ncbi:hypothetical protein BT69DRAFT_1258813 [Atractiella rhizophila]|nr:hypothetical protein BT69DRAFT_1258813 [Atractiella rhizophila]
MSTSPSKGKERADVETPSAGAEKTGHQATTIIVIGMAGSGKSTMIQRLNSFLHTKSKKNEEIKPPYLINLDPAVSRLGYDDFVSIDIRNTVDYKKVMQEYNLGPNGAILTSLNLFTTKFDQVLSYMEKRANTVDHIIIDTPGQIEIFTWSASGAIITDAISSSLPTMVAYIIDTPRSTETPSTFMSNMLYACSILYKTKLPFLLVFNKTDVKSHHQALEWMRDFEAFQKALIDKRRSKQADEGSNYMDDLMNSMSLVLDEFYKNLRAVGVSAMTGEGIQDFFDAVEECRKEYETDYRAEIQKRKEEKEKNLETLKKEQLSRLMEDMKVSSAPAGGNVPGGTSKAADESKYEGILLPDDEEDEDERRKRRRRQRGMEEDEDDDFDQDEDDADEYMDEDRERYMRFPPPKRGGFEDDGMGGRWPAPGGR